ncbi:hypothetical protein DBR47_06735 [Paucibacter sp. KBW04]|uniref:SGNH/GDSL hydrolase family protein n=1 Tax=Paucibacter sp. KBW04 TaxID=2153361 RepID=UPI000F579BEA|nr:GDSL-type esterase/lipase family protein [Paucibacter sp. KBW04]RQO61819.1 hypothetical protein DBR47_06735 [Paucibacter sp. KBW04]
MSRWLRAFSLLALGAAAMLAWGLLQPVEFQGLQDRLRWRLNAVWPQPDPGQLRYEAMLTSLQLRGEASLPAGSVLLFGDSHLQSLPALPCRGAAWANFAIAGEPAQRLVPRLAHYASLKQAGLVILLSGTNDLAQGASPEQAAASMAQVLSQFPAARPLLLLALPPPAQANALAQRQSTLNQGLAELCAQRAACQFLPLSELADGQGLLRPQFTAGDGVHLSAAGYQRLSQIIAAAMPLAAQCQAASP